MDNAQVAVRHFRQILLWPLQLMPIDPAAQIQKHWEHLEYTRGEHPWREVIDEFGDPASFQERHYSEFITFLPHVQRFLYGEGEGEGRGACESPIRVYRRSDIAALRVVFSAERPQPVEFAVAHVDLYFFFDIDVVILAFEMHADDIALDLVQETLYRFGRAYPPFWNDDGSGGHCPRRVEWLDAGGGVLASSDYEEQRRFLQSVALYRAPEIASHWEFLLAPLAQSHRQRSGPIRFRQLEYYRMPLMAYLAVDRPQQLTRAQFVRLALATAPGAADELPFSEQYLADFESRYCYDRGWREGRGGDTAMRMMSCGHATVLVGCSRDKFFTGLARGALAQFRHQYFLVVLIAHLHKAALLMASDRLVDALNHLDINSAESVKRFKRTIRGAKEIFLRFTHRYWFHEVSDQTQARDLYHLCSKHLGTDPLYTEVREEIEDMSDYLDSDSLRRQANTVVRLTVVTTFGLIGTVVTGFLGMNLFAYAEASIEARILYFLLVLVPVTLLTFYTILRSKRLSDFLEALSDERLSRRAKLASLIDVWRARAAR